MKCLLVDGYNVIHTTSPYREIAGDDLASAREALVSDVAAYAQGEWHSTVVFDGTGNPLSDGTPRDSAGVSVVFSRFGTTADSVVEGLAREARERGEHVEVVTSDAQMQWAVMGGKVARRSAAEFAAELRTGASELREHLPAGSAASRIEDRIDPEVRARLERMAREDR